MLALLVCFIKFERAENEPRSRSVSLEKDAKSAFAQRLAEKEENSPEIQA
jgi:hypothetical protein